MKGLFHIVDEGVVILRSKGVYRQAKLFQRCGGLYAAWSGGFIGLRSSNGTTHPLVSWDEIDCPLAFTIPRLGAITLVEDGAS